MIQQEIDFRNIKKVNKDYYERINLYKKIKLFFSFFLAMKCETVIINIF